MATIQLKNLQKIYSGDVLAVKDLSLEINDEEFIVLIGPSGCGKSTILRMIAGLEDITSGDLVINDQVVNEIAPKDRDIAMVFQNYALYPHMTVFNNMAFSLQLKKLPKDVIKAKVEETAKLLDIEHLLDRKPKALSGGQRQRVALGRAMVRDPAIFLLDEPLSNLDAKLRIVMRAEIIKLHRQLKKQGTTFVYVTHDQVEAMTMADRIVILKDGILQQVDTPQQVYDNPVNLFVAGFIGSPPMNFLHCAIKNNKVYYKNTVLSVLEKPMEEMEEVIVGIRPEYLQLMDAHQTTNSTTFSAEVKFVETMGSETYLYSEIHETELVTRIPSDKQIKEGDTVCFAIDSQKLHLFDVTTEERIVR